MLTTILTVLPHAAFSRNVDICDGESFFVGGALQTTSGTYKDTFVAANTCDSVLTTILTVLPHAAFTRKVDICDGELFFVGGALQTTSGTYRDTFVAANTCDSVLTTILTVNPVYSFSFDTTICLGDSYLGVFYESDTILIDSLLTDLGCDSIWTTNVFVEQCCPVPVLLCEDSVFVNINQDNCGIFILDKPEVDSPCNIVSLTNDYQGGPFPEGITTVTWIATDLFGQSDTCTQQVVYQPLNLLSSYTLLAEEEVTLMPNNDVRFGSVGVMNPTGEAYLQNHTQVTGTGSFVAAPMITTFPNTQVSNPIYSPANVTLPPFEQNPVPNSGADVSIGTNQTMVLNDTVYGRIRLSRGSHVIFYNPYGVVNVKEIRVNHKAAGALSILEFRQCTKVRVKERVDLGPRCTINPDSLNVIFYVEGANTDAKDNQPSVDIGPRALVYADFYVPNGRFYAHPGTHVDPAQYYGIYIAKWITGDPDIVWSRRACDPDPSCPNHSFKLMSSTDEMQSSNLVFEAYPNPFSKQTSIQFGFTATDENVSLQVFNASGQLIQVLFEGKAGAGLTQESVFDASNLPSGIYFALLQTSHGTYHKKLVVVH